ncbi:molybdopterin-binding protein [Oribacterium sp. WCC10]|uniref:molybdopterin-binding protein n=1 Tax=Oribacterium sp. WCC10 TaxID=1855343 RepID=UPI0008F225E4|nr:molybdopterin-binding protein [Oribacterium sp. WCC10]SFG29610.1 molybdenum cofactor synthesis domain-containing protein [Oribacterium sp. WCC10]
MKLMRTEDAVGQMLCQDITRIIKDVEKGPVFRKGHVIREEDIPVLLSVGKDHIYIWEEDDEMMHENDAAQVLYDLCRNDNLTRSEDIKEGKLELIAECDGLLKIDSERLFRVNNYGQMMIASVHNNFPVKKGQHIAGMRVIPLAIERSKMEDIKAQVGDEPIFRLLPYQKKKVGLVTTGNEVYYGRIQDTFTPVIEQKLKAFGSEVVAHEISSDDPEMVIDCIRKVLAAGADMVICTGGMSVDPDDKTPYALSHTADNVVTYGAPVLPGAMFMLAYKGENNEIPMLGLPGCVMHEKRTIFDLMLPRILAGEVLTGEDIARLGMGGYCMHCKTCIFPNCSFGVQGA